MDAVVNQRRVLHTWYALMGVIMVDLPLLWVSPPRAWATRSNEPSWSDVVRPTNTRLRLGSSPASTPKLNEVVAGSTRRLRGRHPAASIPTKVALLNYSVDGGNFYLAAGVCPGQVQTYDPWQTHAPERPAIRSSITSLGGRRRVAAFLPDQSPPGADGDWDHARLSTSPPILACPPRSKRRRRGNVEAIEGTTHHRPRHGRIRRSKSAVLDFGQPPLLPRWTSNARQPARRLSAKFLAEATTDRIPMKFRNDRRPDEPRAGPLRHPGHRRTPTPTVKLHRARPPGSSCRATPRSPSRSRPRTTTASRPSTSTSTRAAKGWSPATSSKIASPSGSSPPPTSSTSPR